MFSEKQPSLKPHSSPFATHGMRLAAVWFILVAASVISLFTSQSAGMSETIAALAIIVLIYVKSRLVLFEFMEVGSGSLEWRLFFELWLIAVVGVISFFIYL
jgi:hypothetical protein